jgi:hypothetical protein
MTCDGQKTKDDKDNSNSGSSSSSTTKTIVINPSCTISNAVDISNCKLDGSADGIQQKFDTAKYQVCKLHTNSDKVYYDGFITGCMQLGNTKLICEAIADSNILNIKTQLQTQTTTQPTQELQPAISW